MKNLSQHEKSHKFSTDALLLAQFVPLEKLSYFAELGTGCGIISLEILQRKENIKAVALDYNKDLLKTAKENAKLYNLEKSIIFLEEDFNTFPKVTHEETKQFKNICELVVCNPPWLLKSQGKLPLEEMKRNALFGDEHTYDVFFKASRYFIKERGLLAFITIPQRIETAFTALAKYGYVLNKIQFVHNTKESKALFLLVLAEFKGKKTQSHISQLQVCEPIFLSKKHSNK